MVQINDSVKPIFFINADLQDSNKSSLKACRLLLYKNHLKMLIYI